MKRTISLLVKAIALLCLIGTVGLAITENKGHTQGTLDIRAAALVFLAPLFVLILFQKESLQWGTLFRRFQQIFSTSEKEIYQELEKMTPAARSQYGFSQTVKFGESHSDMIIQYATELYSARFSAEEIARMLLQKIQSEDDQWNLLCKNLGFLAKMAPYFGMLATVLGMIRLLENMTDFGQISGSMALAMQGTLFGLVSFTLVFSPLQKLFMELREQVLKRNEMIARWFTMVARQAEPSAIQHDLRSLYFATPISLNKSASNTAEQARSSS